MARSGRCRRRAKHLRALACRSSDGWICILQCGRNLFVLQGFPAICSLQQPVQMNKIASIELYYVSRATAEKDASIMKFTAIYY